MEKTITPDKVLYYALSDYLSGLHPLSQEPPEIYKTYYLMINEDPQIAQMVEAVKSAISPKFSYWILEGDRESEEYKFIDDTLFKKLTPSFTQVLSKAIMSVFYGISIFDKIYIYDKENKKIILDKLIYREPASIFKFSFTDTKPYDLKKIEFQGRGANNSTQLYKSTIDSLLIFTNDDDGGIINGQSILRPIWKLYKIKKFLYKIMALGISRVAVPIPVGKVKKNVKSEKLNKFQEILQKISVGETSRILIDENEWDIEELGGKGSYFPYDKYVELINKEMNKVFLMSLLSVGIDANAVFTTDIMSDMFYGKIWDLGLNIAKTINQNIIQPLIDMNFNTKNYPVLNIRRVGGRIGDNIDTRSIYMLGQYGFVVPDEDLLKWMREQLGLPPTKKEEK